MVNGRKIFFRGTLECAIFPKTGHPPTDVDSWRRIVRIAKAHGLNTIRFHSWCPPEAAFAAADEVGFYYQVEVASWANGSTRLGDGQPIDEWLYRETGRILKAYGNHPSFVLLPYGNEPAGRDAEFLGRWVEHWKAQDPRRLYTSASGWPQIPENQFHVTPDPRIQAWGAGLTSRINARPPETRTDYRDYVRARTVPVISHEIGQWCVYPNFAERSKYTGYLKAKNFDIFATRSPRTGWPTRRADFLLASGKLQTLFYKEDIESALRTPGMGGFQLLDLHDFPGQGTALVGVLDPFWDSKGYVTADEFRRFAGPPCRSPGSTGGSSRRRRRSRPTSRSRTSARRLSPGRGPSGGSSATTGESRRGARCRRGTCRSTTGSRLGRVSVEPRDARRSAEVPARRGARGHAVRERLGRLGLPAARGHRRARRASPSRASWTRPTAARLRDGGRVVLLVPPGRVRGDALGKVELGFSSIFWNTAWTSRQAPHTLGILFDPKHPALAAFPTEGHSNWQWWYLVSRAGAMILDGLPKELRPTVQVIDDWFTNRRLGLVFEARVGKGRLLVTSIDLERDLEANPVARQMRHSLLRYAASDRFAPTGRGDGRRRARAHDALKDRRSTPTRTTLLPMTKVYDGGPVTRRDVPRLLCRASPSCPGRRAGSSVPRSHLRRRRGGSCSCSRTASAAEERRRGRRRSRGSRPSGRSFDGGVRPRPGAGRRTGGASLGARLRGRSPPSSGPAARRWRASARGRALPLERRECDLHLPGRVGDAGGRRPPRGVAALAVGAVSARRRRRRRAGPGAGPAAPGHDRRPARPPLPRIAVADLGFSDRPGGEMRPPAWSEPARQRAAAAHLERSLAADAELASLVALVERAAPGAAIVVVGDPPPDRGAHGLLTRRDALFDDTLRSALVVATPGLSRPGKASRRLVSTLDVGADAPRARRPRRPSPALAGPQPDAAPRRPEGERSAGGALVRRRERPAASAAARAPPAGATPSGPTAAASSTTTTRTPARSRTSPRAPSTGRRSRRWATRSSRASRPPAEVRVRAGLAVAAQRAPDPRRRPEHARWAPGAHP